MKCFIKLGKVDIKLLYPFFCLVFSIIDSFLQEYLLDRKRGHVIASLLINSVSKMQVIFIYFTLKRFFYKDMKLIENIPTQPKKEKDKKSKIISNDYFIYTSLILSYIIYLVYYVFSRTINNNERNEDNKIIYISHSYGLFVEESIETIFIFILTKYLLNYEYSLHHIISLIFCIIFSISLDVLNEGNIFYKLGGILCFILMIIVSFFESMVIIIQRNMMDNLYYSPFLVCFLLGLIDFVLTILSAIITTSTNGLFCNMVDNEKKCFLPSLIQYFEEFAFIDFVSLISSLFFKSITYFLNIYTIFYLTPNHMLIIYILCKFFENLILGIINFYLWTFFIFPFLLLSYLSYLEIIELNFCGINFDTRKNIEFRAKEESLLNNQKSENENDNNDENHAEIGNYKIKIIDQTSKIEKEKNLDNNNKEIDDNENNNNEEKRDDENYN